MTRPLPGTWIDDEGRSHLSIPEALAFVGLPDTPEHRDILIRMFTALMRQDHPGVTILYRSSPDDLGTPL